MHDEDSAYGLQVRNARGNSWKAYGDKRLLDTVNQANLQMVQAALQVSVDEVWAAYQNGRIGTNQALTYVADLTQVSQPPNTGNPSPLFIPSAHSTGRRTHPANRFDYSWTTNWWGWSTLALLRHLPEFEHLGDATIPITLDADILQLWDSSGKLGFTATTAGSSGAPAARARGPADTTWPPTSGTPGRQRYCSCGTTTARWG